MRRGSFGSLLAARIRPASRGRSSSCRTTNLTQRATLLLMSGLPASLQKISQDRSNNTEENENKIGKDIASIEAVGFSQHHCKESHDCSSDCDQMESVASEFPPAKSAEGEDGKETDSHIVALVCACGDGIPEIRIRDESARQDRKPSDIREPDWHRRSFLAQPVMAIRTPDHSSSLHPRGTHVHRFAP